MTAYVRKAYNYVSVKMIMYLDRIPLDFDTMLHTANPIGKSGIDSGSACGFIDIWYFNATFSNISAISWRPVLVVEEAGENHRPWASNW